MNMLSLEVSVDSVDNNQLSLQLNVQVDRETLHQSRMIQSNKNEIRFIKSYRWHFDDNRRKCID
jgi:hypothetical protein